MNPKAVRAIKISVTVLLLVLILFGVFSIGALTVGIAQTDRTGTFNLFGKSYHLNSSSDMSPAIEPNDLVIVRHASFSDLKEGDIAAFYYTQDGKEHLLLREVKKIEGLSLTVGDGAGTNILLSADSIRVLGKATGKSALLGKYVLAMRSSTGRLLFLAWTLGIAFFLAGATILIHIIWKCIYHRDQLVTVGPSDALTGEPLSFDQVPGSRP